MKNNRSQRQQGASALMLVLLLLMLGVLMLKGLHQQLNSDLRNAASEAAAIKQFSAALSAQVWGMRLYWSPAAHWQCQQDRLHGWRACLRRDDRRNAANNAANSAANGAANSAAKDIVLAAQGLAPRQASTGGAALAAGTPAITVWRLGRQVGDELIFSAHGWSDFCPLEEESACQLP